MANPVTALVIVAASAAACATVPLPQDAARQATRDTPPSFTYADTLRGSITPERAWWDVTHYDLDVRISPADSSIAGSNTITYRVTGPTRDMQIDLMTPLVIDSIVQGGHRLEYRRRGNAFFVEIPGQQPVGSTHTISAYYHGRPRIAPKPPWEGGFTWTKGPQGIPWIATSNQGIGASVWWPNKDHQSDEPDSLRIRVTVPSTLIDVSNGRLADTERHPDGTTSYTWVVRNPINNYNVAINAGNYAHFGDTLTREAGTLDLDYWVLEPHLERAHMQFKQVKPMLRCLEHWFGPYPFPEDGYKLVETPYLGMEHQSAVAYGNDFQMGYLGKDLSGTGWGLLFDFILLHESAHEWFGNNITTADIADMWVHEGFANYAESLYVECLYGEQAGAEYVIGTRGNILNDRPIIGIYGVNHEGSGDMYSKGGNLLHTIRQLVADDARWRQILRGLNREFRHDVVTSRQVEQYIGEQAGLDLNPVFDQYLRHAELPVLEYRIEGDTLHYRWRAQVDDFAMPVLVTVSSTEAHVADAGDHAGGEAGAHEADGLLVATGPEDKTGRVRYDWIRPVTGEWRSRPIDLADPSDFRVDEDFYVEVVEVE